MPAMSPTMTEGNITNWKVKEGMNHFPNERGGLGRFQKAETLSYRRILHHRRCTSGNRDRQGSDGCGGTG